MDLPTSLWKQVGDCFNVDDGSLPSIEIAQLSPDGVQAIYAMLRSRSRLYGDATRELWSRTLEASIPIDSVPNAAVLVTEGHADAFHFGLTSITAFGTELPELGVFVFPDCIELDYRMGPEWGPAQVAGFFELLHDCASLDPAAIVLPAETEGPPYPERFARAWATYDRQR